MKRICYLTGLAAILAVIFFSPLEVAWPRDLLLPLVILWLGLCCIWGGVMKNHSREYELAVGRLQVLLGGTMVLIYLLPLQLGVRIVILLAVGGFVLAALGREGRKEKQRGKKD